MYWNVGKFLSDESKGKEYGDLYIDSVANFIQGEFSGIKGFNRCGLYRMKQFYETYCDNEIVSPLVTQLSWTNNLLILSSTKTMEEKEFYIRLAIKENLGKFKPEYVSKMDFYLEALDRQNKKQHENLSVGSDSLRSEKRRNCRICNEPDNVTYVGFKIYDGTARKKCCKINYRSLLCFLKIKKYMKSDMKESFGW